MSTRINIDVNGFVALKQQADAVAQKNQESAVTRQEEARLTNTQRLESKREKFGQLRDRFRAARKDNPSTDEPRTASSAQAKQPTTSTGQKRNDVPTNELTRELSAFRRGDELVPFAVSWRGNLTAAPQTVWEGILFPEAGTTQTSKITYAGGDEVQPQQFEIASSNDIAQVDQITRYSEWTSVPRLCFNGVCGPSFWIYEGWWAESITGAFISGVPDASISNPVVLTTEFNPAPSSVTPTGPINHSTTGEYLAVKPDGTMFLVVRLPWQPVEITTTELSREVYAANPATTEPFDALGQQQKNLNGGYNGNPVRSPFPSVPLYKIGTTQPVMFIRAKGGAMETKIAGYDTSQSFATFYEANAYSDDPGKELRSSYAGEVRIRGNKAHLLRMKWSEVIDGETYVYYENFPQPTLSQFITGTGALARLRSDVSFEDHIYTLQPYNTDAELAAQLAAITTPAGVQENPPYRAVPINVSKAFVAAASRQLSTAGPDVLTPLTFFAAMP